MYNDNMFTVLIGPLLNLFHKGISCSADLLLLVDGSCWGALSALWCDPILSGSA